MRNLQLLFMTLVLALVAQPVCADIWGSADGASSMKYLSISQTPRQTALVGGGLANPQFASEAAWNPMAGAWSNNSAISGSQVRLSLRLGANWNTVQVVQPVGSVRLLVGANFLNTDDFTQRDEDGFSTGSFRAFAWNYRLGLSSGPGAITWGMQGTYSHYTISEFDAQAFLLDASAGARLGQYFRVAVGAFHYGWMSSFDTEAETPPFTLQAGLAFLAPSFGRFDESVSADLRRENDNRKEVILGFETTYAQMLVLRLGANIGSSAWFPGAGLAVQLGGVEVSYGYGSSSADSQLKGSHHFGLGYSF